MAESKKKNWAEYCQTCRVVGYVRPYTKSLLTTEAKQYNTPMSDIVCKAMDEYYERRPELVANIKNRIGKNSW